MGIYGLSSFFRQNPELSELKYLHDTKLVIDGSNLVYMIYLSSNLECVYGGDYDRYAEAIRDYFAIFKKCNIEVVVVFDGGYDISNSKLKTCQQRMQQRLSAAKHIAKTGCGSRKVLPILAHEVFKDIARELGIPIVQCHFEADEEIVAIANHLGSPVASQDSDFYIFDIKAGFIRLDFIAESVCTQVVNGAEVNCLSCQWYHIDNLLCHFPGFKHSLLPFFGTLLGNDFVDAKMFENFCSRLKCPKQRGPRRKLYICKQHTKMIGLLHWLSSVDENNVITEVLSTLKSSKREEARKIIADNVERYTKCKSSFAEHLMENGPVTFSFASGTPFPSWFTEMLFSGKVSPYVINVAVIRRVFQLVQVDCFEKPSSYICSLTLRQALYGIILGSDSKRNIGQNTVEEFDREGRNMKRFYVEPCFNVPCYGELPELSDIPGMDLQSRQMLLRCLLKCEDINLLCAEPLQLVLFVIHFWLRNSTESTNENLLRSLLLSMVLLRLSSESKESLAKHDPKLCAPSCSKQMSDGLLNTRVILTVSDIPDEVALSAIRNFSKYFSRPLHNHARPFDSELTYSCSQFQTCLLFTRYINRILQMPYTDTEIHFTLNGTFLYNFTKELDSRVQPDLFISEYLGRGSMLDTAFSKFYKMFRETVPDEYFKEKSMTAKPKKRASKHKTLAKDLECDTVSLSNRFGVLL
uniref:Protein asteroid log 1 n=2 Tax=Ornithodoros turicata TaxID=34597 RepID=A0A2R5L4S6_9ACAR